MKTYPEITAAFLSALNGSWYRRDIKSATTGELTLYVDDMASDLRTVWRITPYRKSRDGDNSRGGCCRVTRYRYSGYDARRNMWTVQVGNDAEAMVGSRKGEKEFLSTLRALCLASKSVPNPLSVSWYSATPEDIIAGNVPANISTL